MMSISGSFFFIIYNPLDALVHMADVRHINFEAFKIN